MVITQDESSFFRGHGVVHHAKHHFIEPQVAVGARPVAAFFPVRTPHKRRHRRPNLIIPIGNLLRQIPDIDQIVIRARFSPVEIILSAVQGVPRLRPQIGILRLVEVRQVLHHDVFRREHRPRDDQGDGEEDEEGRGDVPSAAVFGRGRDEAFEFCFGVLVFVVVGHCGLFLGEVVRARGGICHFLFFIRISVIYVASKNGSLIGLRDGRIIVVFFGVCVNLVSLFTINSTEASLSCDK
mmetsp:Transcript_24475/g.46937  ORF Transcript_24475/g.46937 Transcript_24475/m.46937 type:complete len:239 (-) Transcript_24475:380-1096(-)